MRRTEGGVEHMLPALLVDGGPSAPLLAEAGVVAARLREPSLVTSTTRCCPSSPRCSRT